MVPDIVRDLRTIGGDMEIGDGARIIIEELDDQGRPADVGDLNEAGPNLPRWAAPNPFIIVLWVLGVGLVWCGLAWANLSRTVSYSTDGYGQVPVDVVLSSISPFAILVGALTTVGLLFWHAAQWQRRHRF